LKVRLGVFAAFLALFWGGIALVWANKDKMSKNNSWDAVLGLIVFCGLIALLVIFVRGMFRRSRIESNTRRRAKKFDTLLNPNQTKKSWWQFWQSRTNSR